MKTAKGPALLALFALALLIGLAGAANADPQPPAFTLVGVKSIIGTGGTQIFLRANLSGFSPLSSGSVSVAWPGASKVTTFSTSELYYDQLGDGSYYRHLEAIRTLSRTVISFQGEQQSGQRRADRYVRF